MKSGATQADALQALSEILLEYGRRRTNPVLDVLPATEPFRLNQKYPEQRLHFGEDNWRAYYHSHSDQYRAPWDEHGHFHLFYRIENQGDSATDWSHIAALSMSAEGQPVRWFTVNNWVCGDRWQPATNLVNQIQFSIEGGQPVNRWLAAMAGFYQEQIIGLLYKRDQELDSARGDRIISDALSDRNIYYLANQAIDLKRELSVALDQDKQGKIHV
jgi:hypothetical protein